MLVQQVPELVNRSWHVYAALIGRSLPPMITKSFDGMANVLRSILMEDLVVWQYQEDNNVIFVLTTSIVMDHVTMQRSLLIYSFTGMGDVRTSHMEKSLDTLVKYARHNQCDSIIAYSEHPNVVKFMKNNGATTDFTFIHKEV